MIGKKWIAGILSAAMLASCGLPIYAAEGDEVLLNRPFDNEVSALEPDGATVSEGFALIRDEKGTENKVLSLEGENNTKIYYPITDQNRNYIVVSLELTGKSSEVSGQIAFAASASAIGSKVIEISENTVKTADGKYLSGLRENAKMKLTMAFNNKKGTCNIYVDGKLKAKEWKMKSTVTGGIQITKTAGSLWLDNLCAYTGKDLEKKMESLGYNPEGDAEFVYDYYTNNDQILIDTDQISDVWWDRQKTYKDCTVAAKGNNVMLNRVEQRLDPYRENNCIVLEKINSNDCHVDFYALSGKYGVFPYYSMEGKIQVEKFGANIHFGLFRDQLTTGSNTDVSFIQITPNGQLVIGPTGQVLKQLSEGEWVKIYLVLDMKSHTADCYLNDSLAASDIPFSTNINNIVMTRLWAEGAGTGKVNFDAIKMIGCRNADTNGKFDHQSTFSSDDSMVNWLSDKVAFRENSRNVFANGQKNSRMDQTIKLDNGDNTLYATVKSINLAYGTNLTEEENGTVAKSDALRISADSDVIVQNGSEKKLSHKCFRKDGKLYIPVKDFATAVMGHHTYEDGHGLLITSQNAFKILPGDSREEYEIVATESYNDYNRAKLLNWFMLFERPTAQKLAEDYKANAEENTQHPRLLATKADIDRIKENKDKDETLNKIVTKTIEKANSYLDIPLPEWKVEDKQRLVGWSNGSYVDMMLYLGLAYQITGDTKYSDRVVAVIDKVLTYPDFNLSHLIDAPMSLCTISFAYDFIYDTLTPQKRTEIYQGLKKLVLNDLRNAYYNLLYMEGEYASACYFVQSKTNFNAVINSGMIVSALAFADEDPDFCFDAIEKALRSLEYSVIMYEPDGAWIEGIGYWNLTGHYLSYSMSSLEHCTGESYGLMDNNGISKTAMFYRSMDSYGGGNNFHDVNEGRATNVYHNWFSLYYNTPELAVYRKKLIQSDKISPVAEDAIWYIYGEPNEDNLPLDVWTRGLDSVASRSSYTDNQGMYFSAHGGRVYFYHSHADVGAFVFDLGGYRWASDIGMEDYNIGREGGGGFYQPYRKRAEAHNVMVFNPNTSDKDGGQNMDGVATMIRCENKDRGMLAIYDLQNVYDESVSTYRRGFYVGDDRRSLTVRDEFTTKADMPAYWFMETPAKVEIKDNHTLILERGGRKLKMEILSTLDDYTVTAGASEPLLGAPILPNQNVNAGITRIALKFDAKADKADTITVKMSLLGEGTEPISDLPTEQWSIPDGEYKVPEPLNATIYANGRNVNEIMTNGSIGLIDGEELPQITAVPENPKNHIEVIYSQEKYGETTVRVYNEDYSKYSEIYVAYNISESADLSSFERLDIKEINVSSTPEPENKKENMLDNDFSTRWTSANQVGETAVFDLGEVKRVDCISMAFWRGSTRHYMYELQVSEDGENWQSVAQGQSSGKSEGMENVEFPSVNARYVKFIGGGNSQNGHSNILEFAILQRK